MTEPLSLDLPWPPSVNHYWLVNGKRRYISNQGIMFRNQTWSAFLESKHKGFGDKRGLKMTVHAYPPDKRRRDIDNIIKCIADSLQYSMVYIDDNQLDEIHIIRMPENLGGVRVKIECL